MQRAEGFRGVYAVLPSPFRDDGALDLDGLERCVRFCIDAGVHGLVGPVNASEFTALSADERRAFTERTLAVAANAVPVVIGVSATDSDEAVAHARHARAHNASAVMAMAPYLDPRSRREVLEHFARIASAFRGPVFIQSYHAYPASQLPVDLMVEIAASIDGIWYVKEETHPAGQRMTRLLAEGAGVVQGVMGGMASRYVIDEFARGACGTMPACEVVDVHIALWCALEEGRLDDARSIHDRLLPLLNFEQLYGALAYKSVLRRRGVIDHAVVRDSVARRLDAYDEAELTHLMDRVADLFTWAGPQR